MGTIDDYGRQNYNFNVSIFIDDDDKNYIVKNRDYSIDIKLRIDDPDKSNELLETFCVHFHTNKLDIASHDSFSKFKFEDSNEAECSLKIKPEEIGDTEFCLDFYQNRNMFYQKKFNVKIVSPEYAP